MHQAVEDGIGHGGVGDDFVPLLDGELAGDQGGAVAAAIVEDFQKVAVLSGADGGHAQIVDDEEAGFLDALE